MAGPWEAFANQPVQEAQGPWTAFASPVETSPGKEAPTRVTMDMSKVPVQQTTSPAASLTLDFLNQGSAAGQRTTPNIAAQMKNFISDDVHENDAGEVLYRDPQSGKLVPTDQNKQVALRDPTDGKIKVFARTPDTDEGVLSSLGRLVMTGSGAGAPTARAALPPSAAAAPQITGPGQEVVAAADRLSSVAGPVNVPRAIASDSMAVQRVGQGIRNIPVVGDAIPQATARLVDDLGNAVVSVADKYGAGSGPNVANRVGRAIADSAEAETAAARGLAQRSDDALLADWQRWGENANGHIAAREADALANTRRVVGDMSPQDMGHEIIGRVRAGEQAARANKDNLYRVAGNTDAAINSDAVGAVRSTVAQSLENEGRVIDGVLPPASSRMLDELGRFSNLNIENRAVGAGAVVSEADQVARAAVSVRGIEQTRKRLYAMSRAATNDADRASARVIMREFDNWESSAFDNALFSGSESALNAYRRARDANRNWRQAFFNNRDDADRIINRVVSGEVTPQEVSNWIIGAGQIGANGVSSRLLTRLNEVTGGDTALMDAIRGGIWNKLSQTPEGVAPKSFGKVADGISEFLNGSGRDVANRLFSGEQRGIMTAYADTLRSGHAARSAAADVVRNTKPQAMDAGIGPMQELANTVLGKNGKTDEALFSAINAYAKSGGRGDINTLARLLRALPQETRGDLAGSIIRNIGISPRTGQFSPDVFVSQWQSYTPQAKTILFGNAGAHRQALDDIMSVSQRVKSIGQRFGNPSGTAQNVNSFGLVAGLIASPVTTLGAAVGGAAAARILAAPASASSAAKWSRSYFAAVSRPSPSTISAYQIASRNLINTAKLDGVSVENFISALQGPMNGRADDENPESKRVIYR